MLLMRAAKGTAAKSSSRSVAARPGVTSVAPEITRGLPEPASPVANVSMALASVRVAASLTLGATKARWMTPSLSRAACKRAALCGVGQVTAQDIGAHAKRAALAEASERS